jgi:hypothetical protein
MRWWRGTVLQAAGADITYERNTAGGHVAEMEMDMTEQLHGFVLFLMSHMYHSHRIQSPKCYYKNISPFTV